MDYGIRWKCPKCNKEQTRRCTVRNEDKLDDKVIVQKARKVMLICIRDSCKFNIRWSNLPSSKKRFINLQEAKKSEEITYAEFHTPVTTRE